MFKKKTEESWNQARREMVEYQIQARGISDPRVLAVIKKVPRHLFLVEELWETAYDDRPLPIGEEQTISQPYMVALMTEALELKGNETVLEVGTGSGYQAAILAELAARVFSLERVDELVERASRIFNQLGYSNICIRIGDGTRGLEEEAPFDAILVTAGAPSVPPAYLEQLAVGGRLVIPVGSRKLQSLKKIVKSPEGNLEQDLGGCRFVPLLGEFAWKEL
ncbi:MAG: protein-L-isoaspartate(D-aspartate) O-methyltransferase [Thermodesulfobacteriota bacterium]